MSLFKRLKSVVGVTLILWAFSERIFWSFWRPDENFGEAAFTLFVYFIATYGVCLLLKSYEVRSVWGLVLVGAIYGWITEGLVAMTFFGAGGIPLPFSISWTGLAWHMLISVLLVLWIGRDYLQSNFWRSAGFNTLLGLFWGLWSMTWFFETPPVFTTPEAFAVHAWIMGCFLVLGHLLLNKSSGFNSTKTEGVVIFGLILVWALTVTFLTVGPFLVILLFLFGITLWLLHKEKRRPKPGFLVLDKIFKPAPVKNILTLFLIPFIASGFYQSLILGVIPPVPFNWVVLFVTTIAGFYFYTKAALEVLKTKNKYFDK